MLSNLLERDEAIIKCNREDITPGRQLAYLEVARLAGFWRLPLLRATTLEDFKVAFSTSWFKFGAPSFVKPSAAIAERG